MRYSARRRVVLTQRTGVPSGTRFWSPSRVRKRYAIRPLSTIHNLSVPYAVSVPYAISQYHTRSLSTIRCLSTANSSVPQTDTLAQYRTPIYAISVRHTHTPSQYRTCTLSQCHTGCPTRDSASFNPAQITRFVLERSSH
eukprot:1217281-Rhodomonas_salina.1